MSPKSSKRAGDGNGPAAGSGRDSYLIASLARGLAVLDSFSPARPELSLKDIEEVAEVSPASAVRIGHTLVAAGYLVRNPATKGFRPGPHMIGAGLATLASLTLPEVAEPFLLELRDRSEATASLGVPAADQVVVVFRAPSRAFPPGIRYPGGRLPYHMSSLGLAILAALPPAQAEAILARARPGKLTARSLTVAGARRELGAVRRRGYALNDQGTTAENRSVSAPLLGPERLPVGAIGLSVPAQQVSLRELERRLAPLVVEAAAAVSASIPPDLQGSGWTAFS